MAGKEGLIRWFSELGRKDVNSAGFKGAYLADMYNSKLPVPPGFVITSEAYRHFVDSNGLQKHISNIIRETNMEDSNALKKASQKIRQLIEGANFPQDLKSEIIESYEVLDVDKKHYAGAKGGAADILRNSYEPPFVAVRSSVISENSSFAGLTDTFLNVKGEEDLISAVKKVFSSLFTERSLYYKYKKGILSENNSMSVIIQNMVDSQKSGVAFSRNPVKSYDNIIIEATWGLGLGVSLGAITPDFYSVNRKNESIDQKVSDKKSAFVRNSSGKTELVNLKEEASKKEVLNGHEIKMISHLAKRLEELYENPQSLEFAVSDGNIFILQNRSFNEAKELNEKEFTGNIAFSGTSVSSGIITGDIKVIRDETDLESSSKDKILVVKNFNDAVFSEMLKSRGIILEKGGYGSNQAFIARELGIPMLIGSTGVDEKFEDGQTVSVDAHKGKALYGKVVQSLPEVRKVLDTKTKLRLITDIAENAEAEAGTGIDEIGLVRIEKIAYRIGKHPLWYIKNDKLKDYTSELFEHFKKIAAPFKGITIRTSDLSGEEVNCVPGGPEELFGKSDPMGNHGVRFSLTNVDFFEAELRAIKDLADEFEDKEVRVLIPQIVSVQEVSECNKIFDKMNFPKNVKFGIMIETPAAVQTVEDLCDSGIDFAVIGPHDLTQYTLAVEHTKHVNGELIENPIYDEMHPAMLKSYSEVIKVCRKKSTEISFCLQTGSKPALVAYIVSEGIDAICVQADKAFELSKIIYQEEMDKIPLSERTYPEELDEPVSDEYYPGGDEGSDVPSLNEAISLSSEDFIPEKKEEIIEIHKVSPGFDFFDKLLEEALHYHAVVEVEKMQRYERAKEVESKKETKEDPNRTYEDEILDIF